MRKTHYIPITADVPGAANDANCALISPDHPHGAGGGGTDGPLRGGRAPDG